jgi:hypothetical protein
MTSPSSTGTFPDLWRRIAKRIVASDSGIDPHGCVSATVR